MTIPRPGPFYDRNMDAITTEFIWGAGFTGMNDGSWHHWPIDVLQRAMRRPWIIPTWRLPDPNPFPVIRIWRRK